jgi:Holliday junction resolvase-like predicted endonuclease
MATESQLQSKIIKHLHSLGCYTMKNDPRHRAGVPDLAFWHSDMVGFIEVKAHENSPFRPLQKPTIEKLQNMGIFVVVIYTENWEEYKEKFNLWLGV